MGGEIEVFRSGEVLVQIIFDEYRFDVVPVDVHGLHFLQKAQKNTKVGREDTDAKEEKSKDENRNPGKRERAAVIDGEPFLSSMFGELQSADVWRNAEGLGFEVDSWILGFM